MWLHRNELSREEKRLRSLYQSLGDDLERYLVQFALVDSYFKFRKAKAHYPFVEKREMKPRAKVMEREQAHMEGFIVIYTEDALGSDLKSNIRHFDSNKVTREHLGELKLTGYNISDRFQAQQRYFDNKRFYDLLRSLLPVDYALLVQRDMSVKSKNRFALSHYHVRIDWLLDAAAEALGRELRYISKDLYEKGEAYAEAMVERLFEYYSFHHTVSGRRTAAMLASQLLRQAHHLSTVFVASSESRTMSKLSEKGVSKYMLLKLDRKAIKNITDHANGNPDFARKFLIHETSDHGVALFQVVYRHNEHSKLPADGKLRELRQDVNWLRIRNQMLIPVLGETDTRPIRYQTIYDQADPLS